MKSLIVFLQNLYSFFNLNSFFKFVFVSILVAFLLSLFIIIGFCILLYG